MQTIISGHSEPWVRWLRSQEGQIKPTTYSTYQRAAERHLSRLPWENLTQEDVGSFLSSAELSSSTKRILASMLRRTLALSGTSLTVKAPPAASPDAKTLSDEEAARLIHYLISSGDRVSVGILLAINAGLRIGEICAMRWEDISLSEGTVCVRRTVQRIKNDAPDESGRTRLYFGEPKSRSSRRTLPLPSFLIALLSRHEQDGQCYILTGSERVMEPRTLQYRFKRILHFAGVQYVNFHALRHTFATRAISCGVDIKTLSKLLGHSNVQTTLNIYVHPSMSHMRECMELLAPCTGYAQP